MDAYNAWIAKGAQPSERVKALAKGYKPATEEVTA